METAPRRQRERVCTDPDALDVVELLRQVSARVDHEPAITPYQGGMLRLGSRDRASYVWFLRCPEGFTPPAPVSGGGLCNHGLGVDRQYGAFEVRAWAHGAPKVHSVSIHTHEVTLDLLESAARMVGIPLKEGPEKPVKTWTHGSRLGRDHFEVRRHLAEDHDFHADYLDTLSDGGIHGLHDGIHGTTWAYAANLSHSYCPALTLDVKPARHLEGTRPEVCSMCMEYLRGDKG